MPARRGQITNGKAAKKQATNQAKPTKASTSRLRRSSSRSPCSPRGLPPTLSRTNPAIPAAATPESSKATEASWAVSAPAAGLICSVSGLKIQRSKNPQNAAAIMAKPTKVTMCVSGRSICSGLKLGIHSQGRWTGSHLPTRNGPPPTVDHQPPAGRSIGQNPRHCLGNEPTR